MKQIDSRSVTLPQNIPALTGIRAIAALLVLLMHANFLIPCDIASILPFVPRGALGVDLFFILSGFIMTHVYLASLVRPSWQATRIFLWHRLIRLYPIHFTVLIIFVVLTIAARKTGLQITNPDYLRFHDLYAHLLLIHAWGFLKHASWNGPAWSISAEWFAYLLFPMTAFWLGMISRASVAFFISAIALVLAGTVFITEGWSLPKAILGPPALIRITGEFLSGAALCRVVTLYKAPEWFGDAVGIAALGGFLFGASIGLHDFFLVIMLAISIPCIAIAKGPLARWLGSYPIRWLGEISYSLYMVHHIDFIVAGRVYNKLGIASWGQFGQYFAYFASIGAAVGSAAILFYIVEKPIRHRFRNTMGVNDTDRKQLTPIVTSAAHQVG